MQNKYLALDVGRARIGLAVANSIARIAAPLPAIINDDTMLTQLQAVLTEEDINQLIVGWPRNLSGEPTEQTQYVDGIIKQIEQATGLPVARQDEAVTSIAAETELRQRGKDYSKGDIDSLSAVYILEDYLQGIPLS